MSPEDQKSIMDSIRKVATRMDRMDAQFNEKDHPRAEDGEFTSGGGVKKSSGKDWSFTDPKRPLFGPGYEESKRKSNEAMDNLRNIMGKLDQAHASVKRGLK